MSKYQCLHLRLQIIVSPLKIISALWIMIFAGCAVQSVLDTSYISDSINDRIGHSPRDTLEDSVFSIPDGISLDDGLTIHAAVAIALWNNAHCRQLHCLRKRSKG